MLRNILIIYPNDSRLNKILYWAQYTLNIIPIDISFAKINILQIYYKFIKVYTYIYFNG